MAKKPLALLSADWHVRKGDRVWPRIPLLEGDVSNSIYQITDIAEKEDVSHVLLAGDILEKQTQTSDVAQTIRRAMDQFERRNQAVLYVQGQHELASPPWLSAIHEWPQHAPMSPSERLVIGDYTVFGCDYLPIDTAEETLSTLPKFDILLTHQVWNHPSYLGSYGYVDTAWVPDHYKMVVTGDYHVHQAGVIDNKVFLSPGSIAMQKIDESPDKYVYILYDDLSYKSVQLKTRPFVEVAIDTADELDRFISEWDGFDADGIDVPLYRVRFNADLLDAKARITRCVKHQAHLYLDPYRHVVDAPDVSLSDIQKAIDDNGLVGCIKELYGDDVSVMQAAIRLIESNNVEEEIKAIFTQEDE